MVKLSPGQWLARHQIEEIAAKSEGALEITGAPYSPAESDDVVLRLSLETRHYRHAGGLPLRDREPLLLRLHPDFPFKKPSLYFKHKRFIGYPHIQWGRSICLYQSETEYDPADGMFGFMERVRVWMLAAGRGQLDPDDAPLHPPVAYASSTFSVVIRANTPPIELDGSVWFGRADLKKVRDDRLDLLGWSHIADWEDGLPAHPVAGAILLSKPLATEYPSKVNDLLKLVEGAGVEFGSIYTMLRLISFLSEDGDPGFLVLGATMRRKAAGEPLRQHLTVWEIGAEPMKVLRAIIKGAGEDIAARDALVKWMVEADVRWCTVLEDRTEIVHRRDGDTVLSAIAGKRILLLGCGALGSAVAETIVRAGAASLHLVDRGIVRPGLLVRQRFSDADIGLPKARALRDRLDSLGLACQVTNQVCDLSTAALSRFNLEEVDVVVDATASIPVTHRIERDLRERALSVPLISMTVSAAASHGCVSVRMPEFEGGPHGLARQAKLEAFAHNLRHPLVKAFWPDPSQATVFQPEPGCSEPTFIASAADIDHHAAGLLNVGVRRATDLKAGQASMDLMTAPWVPRSSRQASQLGYTFGGCARTQEERHGYSVLVSPNANRGMAAAMRRIARVQSDKFETGGLIFGEIDDSHRIVWIDSVSGPPPDSESSPEQFLCGVSGTAELARLKVSSTGGSSQFVGIWHTHPVSVGRPSADDLIAMFQLLHLQEHPPRQVVMLIVGMSATTPKCNYYLFRRDEFQLIAYDNAVPEAGE